MLFLFIILEYDHAFNPDILEINNEAYNNPGVMVRTFFDLFYSGYLERATSFRVGHP
jgi:hypothetical protein